MALSSLLKGDTVWVGQVGGNGVGIVVLALVMPSRGRL